MIGAPSSSAGGTTILPADEAWMRVAIDVARGNPAAPFGAVVVGPDGLLARGVNRADADPTAHGEIEAIRALGAPRRAPGLVLYTTAEPCPMCAAACVWAGLDRVVYGVSIPWLRSRGWRQIGLRAADVLASAPRPVAIAGGACTDGCAALFEDARPRAG